MAETPYRVVALSSDRAPGTDAEFVRFGAPVINAAGDVAFQAFLTGPTTDVVPHGIWVGTASGIRPLAIAGEEAPGTDEARFRTPGPPLVLTSNGQSLFYGQLLDQGGVTSDNDYGLWVGPPAGVQLAARRSAPAPGLPPGVNYNLFFANPHSSGVMGLTATLAGTGVDPSNDSAAWIGPLTSTGSLQLIARAGDSAPGLPAGSRFRVLGAPLLNSHGHLAMGAGAFNNELPPVFIPGIWGGMPQDLSLLSAANSSAPGAPGRHFSYFGEPRISSSGHVAFMGYLNAETSEQQVSDVGIWVGDVDGRFIQPVAIEGQPAPEFGPTAVFRGSAPGDETYYNPFSEPVLSGWGRVAFAGTVLGNGIDFDHNNASGLRIPLMTRARRDVCLWRVKEINHRERRRVLGLLAYSRSMTFYRRSSNRCWHQRAKSPLKRPRQVPWGNLAAASGRLLPMEHCRLSLTRVWRWNSRPAMSAQLRP
jgi:hypothetical protein